MAYTSGIAGTAVGALLTILDVDLVANDKWTIHDAAAGVNAKVYRCYDAPANVDFYVYVNDNIGTVYAKFELWEDWDEVGHAGVGASISAATNDFLIRKDAGGYGLCVSDHRFIHIDFVRYVPTYIGQLTRFDTSKNMPMTVCSGDTADTLSNPLGFYNIGTSGQWKCLFDENETARLLQPVGKNPAQGRVIKTISGGYWVPEIAVYNETTLLLMGTLEGVGAHIYVAANGLVNGDIITIDAVEWVALFGDGSAYGCLVRKS